MFSLMVLLLMIAAALAGFLIMRRLMIGQKFGAALSVGAICVAAFVVCLFFIRLIKSEEVVFVVAFAFVIILPAILGMMGGGLLGWIIVQRRQRR